MMRLPWRTRDFHGSTHIMLCECSLGIGGESVATNDSHRQHILGHRFLSGGIGLLEALLKWRVLVLTKRTKRGWVREPVERDSSIAVGVEHFTDPYLLT
ncbi:hypothetical protein CEXT_498751 [Caerostris extrusa]|uniref:Uncharacterized protein n=1 Tax=Caerostris extrusa TaxID=172846 RepID=A0AAV4NBT1_CAEEX|nr:hypothetical protein CEXT_498751 [Caerostris extrusa]